MASSKTILVVAAHPDDEVLGCGATIALHAKSGDKVVALVFTNGISSRIDANSQNKGQTESFERQASANRAANILGLDEIVFLDFPDNRMDSRALLDAVKEIEAVVARYRPSVIYTHHGGDVNIDHRIVHDATIVATRPIAGYSVKELLFFETPSSTEWMPGISRNQFTPNLFVDVTKTFDCKIEALSAYEMELREFPHPRSREAVAALAQWRGASAGVLLAEAFEVGRLIR